MSKYTPKNLNMEKWQPIDDGYFVKFYKKKLEDKGFEDTDISKIIENSKDVLSKSINHPKLNKNITIYLVVTLIALCVCFVYPT